MSELKNIEDFSFKFKIVKIVNEATHRIRREKDPEKRRRLTIIKKELSKLADEL